jgi:cyclase
VIASGGAGAVGDFVDLFTQTESDAALAASIFHSGEVAVSDLKRALVARGIPVRPVEEAA